MTKILNFALPVIGLIIGIIIVLLVCLVMEQSLLPKSPEETFDKDLSIIEYCYLDIVTKNLPVSNGRETRIQSTDVVQKVCVDRNLSIISSVPFDNSHVDESYMYWHKTTRVK